jgi:hypothetical protein
MLMYGCPYTRVYYKFKRWLIMSRFHARPPPKFSGLQAGNCKHAANWPEQLVGAEIVQQ